MEVLCERCCGLDVHKKSVVACLVVPGGNGETIKEIRTFGTMTVDILALSDWLASAGCTHVAMESTGVYWKPIYNLLEGGFELLLVNAQHIKAVPGRKTDVKDCEWIADLLRHGLLRASFIPNRPHRELRELTRYRTSLIRERTSEVNRLQKTLEGANIKLASVASSVMGKSAREMLDALVAGSTNVKAMAQLAKAALRRKIPELEQALTGQFQAHQRYMVAEQLAHIDYLDDAIARLSQEIEGRLGQELEEQGIPFDEAVVLLDTIPGVNRRVAEGLLAEIGTDMGRFATAGHLASYAGMAPGNNESAGKRKSGKTRKGSPWLRSLLAEAAQAAVKSSGNYLSAQFRQLAARRGKNKAIIAVGHTILVIAYHLLKGNEVYKELGANYYDERNRQSVERRSVRRLEKLGYKVSLQPISEAA